MPVLARAFLSDCGDKPRLVTNNRWVIGQNVLVLPYNPNFILWTLATLCLSSELVYIYLTSHPLSIYVVVLRSISVFGGIKRGIINPNRA